MSLFQQTIASRPDKINRIKNYGFKFRGIYAGFAMGWYV